VEALRGRAFPVRERDQGSGVANAGWAAPLCGATATGRVSPALLQAAGPTAGKACERDGAHRRLRGERMARREQHACRGAGHQGVSAGVCHRPLGDEHAADIDPPLPDGAVCLRVALRRDLELHLGVRGAKRRRARRALGCGQRLVPAELSLGALAPLAIKYWPSAGP
jgi:hypothetical protein